MTRLGLAEKPPFLFARIVYWSARRRLGQVPWSVQAHARHPQVFGGFARMELGQDKACRVPLTLKTLVGIRCATLIGCPF